MSSPRLAFYGDDVTGSVDVLLQFARFGASGCLFVGVPTDAALRNAAATSEVVGIAGIARSLPTADLDAEVRPALEALVRTGAPIVQYKACSTADSSPTIGSLGRILEIGQDVFGPRPVPMLFAQPDFGRHTVFGHHFAAEAGAVHRLDRQPTMSTHPSTPMTESHLPTHLSRQTPLPIGGVPLTEYTDAAALAARITGSPDAAVVLDALDDGQVRLVGDAVVSLAPPAFVVGSGGLSRGIAGAGGRKSVSVPRARDGSGPVLVVSGSRSPQTRRQADAAAAEGWLVAPLTETTDASTAALRSGRSVVLTSDDASVPADTDVLAVLAERASAAVRAAVEAGVTTRVIVCGGDTSGRVVRLLGIESLSIAANPGGNVVVLRAHAAGAAVDGLELLLKGGQVGSDDLFESIRAGAEAG